jgi:hypothetical protein
MPLVEELLGGLHDGGDDARFADDAARSAHGAVTHALRNHADLERELRCAGERIAAFVHRRRARVCCLAVPRDAMPLDAVGAEDDAEWQIERLEDGTLLDVQLEVGGRRAELAARVDGRVELDAVRRARREA